MLKNKKKETHFTLGIGSLPVLKYNKALEALAFKVWRALKVLFLINYFQRPPGITLYSRFFFQGNLCGSAHFLSQGGKVIKR